MLQELRKRFILFNMLVITGVLAVMWLGVFLWSDSHPSAGRLIPMLVVSLLLVFTASYIISKFALQPVKRSWQKQLDFTADASHELRTPLAVIQTNLEIVMDSPDETVASQMKWLRNIEAEHTLMTKLVDDLLTLSRADSGEQSLFMSTFLLDETVRQTIDLFQPLCQEKGLVLESRMATNIALTGDEKRLAQLLVILLDNAVQYTPAPGAITVGLQRAAAGIELTVEDSGIGMTREDTAKIFERFYRVDNARRHNPDGSGLGLAIAQWIVRQHHGKIAVHSQLDAGTKISVTIPAPAER